MNSELLNYNKTNEEIMADTMSMVNRILRELNLSPVEFYNPFLEWVNSYRNIYGLFKNNYTVSNLKEFFDIYMEKMPPLAQREIFGAYSGAMVKLIRDYKMLIYELTMLILIWGRCDDSPQQQLNDFNARNKDILKNKFDFFWKLKNKNISLSTETKNY